MFHYSPLPVDFVSKLEEGPLVFSYGALIYSICKSQKTLMFFFYFQKPNYNFPFFTIALTQIIEPVLCPRLVALHLRTDRVHSRFYLWVWIATYPWFLTFLLDALFYMFIVHNQLFSYCVFLWNRIPDFLVFQRSSTLEDLTSEVRSPTLWSKRAENSSFKASLSFEPFSPSSLIFSSSSWNCSPFYPSILSCKYSKPAFAFPRALSIRPLSSAHQPCTGPGLPKSLFSHEI